MAPSRAGKLLPPARSGGSRVGMAFLAQQSEPRCLWLHGAGVWDTGGSRGEAPGVGGFPAEPCRDAPGLMAQPGHPLPAAISPQKQRKCFGSSSPCTFGCCCCLAQAWGCWSLNLRDTGGENAGERCCFRDVFPVDLPGAGGSFPHAGSAALPALSLPWHGTLQP